MPRGRKKLGSVPEQIAATEERIAQLKAELKAANAKLAELKATQDNELKEKLVDAVKTSGKSLEEVIALIQN